MSGYATPMMTWAVSNGIVSGVGNNKIAPTSDVTRAMATTILVRYLNY